ncbi:hypothetical protein IGI04_001286 [Brassica rapa subsp. trilocularis]|uniref:E3 ubiquitin-protein ligase RNF123/RKP TPR repeat domain-containing protein n=1 Tax=Brassica rapa subsp. trilocularis TaxID=1813537 RepID=A0ABQ7KH37_BRACM|nr:hypothetical protein IGI04_042962 [Brassica rapa subsp. trilocularis]KAG5411005.1 hypothetical protein IGI04_007324 [Brassica rapa subsp. trilocularis]KAG5413719.1 hypothetical protein IGI04_001286 [Brassica rapa subsp. trilocularis]
MAHSFTFLADQKVGRCSNNEEAIQHVSWTITEFSFSVMEFQQRKCCVILELSSNLPRVLEVCTSAIPQAFLDGTDTNPSRLAEEGTNVPEVALPEVVVPGRDDKDGLMLPVPDNLTYHFGFLFVFDDLNVPNGIDYLTAHVEPGTKLEFFMSFASTLSHETDNSLM